MDDFTPDIRITLDDAVDAEELLSFRYTNQRSQCLSVCHTNIVSQSRALDADRYTMNSITIIGIIGLFIATNFIWYWQGYKDGRRDGWHKGRNLARTLVDR